MEGRAVDLLLGLDMLRRTRRPSTSRGTGSGSRTAEREHPDKARNPKQHPRAYRRPEHVSGARERAVPQAPTTSLTPTDSQRQRPLSLPQCRAPGGDVTTSAQRAYRDRDIGGPGRDEGTRDRASGCGGGECRRRRLIQKSARSGMKVVGLHYARGQRPDANEASQCCNVDRCDEYGMFR